MEYPLCNSLKFKNVAYRVVFDPSGTQWDELKF